MKSVCGSRLLQVSVATDIRFSFCCFSSPAQFHHNVTFRRHSTYSHFCTIMSILIHHTIIVLLSGHFRLKPFNPSYTTVRHKDSTNSRQAGNSQSSTTERIFMCSVVFLSRVDIFGSLGIPLLNYSYCRLKILFLSLGVSGRIMMQ